MKNWLRTIVWSTVAFVAGCHATNIRSYYHWKGIDAPPAVTTIVYSMDMYEYEAGWAAEASRRYPNCVVVMSHGSDLFGEWYCDYYDMRRPVVDVVAEIRERYPTRQIVLAVCNPGGYDIDIPGVTHAMSNVWLMPDRTLHWRTDADPAATGNIFEFDED